MQLVENDGVEIAEKESCIGAREQQRHLLRGRQQDFGWRQALALAFALWGVASAGLDADLEAHLGDRHEEIARDVDGECLQRRDIQRAQSGTACRSPSCSVRRNQAREETGQRLAGAGRRNQQRGAPCRGLCEQGKLVRTRLPAFRREPAGERLRQGSRHHGGRWAAGGFRASGSGGTRTHGRETTTLDHPRSTDLSGAATRFDLRPLQWRARCRLIRE